MTRNAEPDAVITVVLADDHAVVRKGLQAFFETTGDIRVLATAANAAGAVAAAEKAKPTIVLLDLFLPDQAAVETIGQIRAVSPDSRIVVLTSHEGNEYLAEVLRAGALSYVLKDITPEELTATIRKAAEGESILDERLAKTLLGGPAGKGGALYERLTEREREILRLIAKGMTNSEIAAGLFISETTVKSHVSNILSKLYLTDRTKLAVYAWEKGLMR